MREFNPNDFFEEETPRKEGESKADRDYAEYKLRQKYPNIMKEDSKDDCKGKPCSRCGKFHLTDTETENMRQEYKKFEEKYFRREGRFFGE